MGFWMNLAGSGAMADYLPLTTSEASVRLVIGSFIVGLSSQAGRRRRPIRDHDHGCPTAFSATDYQNMVNSYGSEAAQVQALYPLNKYSTPELAMDAIGTDPWACKQRGINTLLGSQVPVYAYEFDDRTAPIYYPRCPVSSSWPLTRATSNICSPSITAAR